jgi:hypothetical protein
MVVNGIDTVAAAVDVVVHIDVGDQQSVDFGWETAQVAVCRTWTLRTLMSRPRVRNIATGWPGTPPSPVQAGFSPLPSTVPPPSMSPRRA